MDTMFHDVDLLTVLGEGGRNRTVDASTEDGYRVNVGQEFLEEIALPSAKSPGCLRALKVECVETHDCGEPCSSDQGNEVVVIWPNVAFFV